MRTCAFATFGCKTNQYETQAIREQVLQHGLKEVSRKTAADLYVINTCVVTEEALKKSVRSIQRALKSNPSARVVVTGCLVNYNKKALEALTNDRVLLLTNAQKQKTARAVFEHNCSETDSWPIVSGNAGHTRAFLKIQDGCDAFCSYCVVPFVRGAPRSRSENEIEREVERLAQAGFRELVLTGIHIGLYGRDSASGVRLPELLERVAKKHLFPRIRLSDVEVIDVTDSLLSVMKNYPEICPHLHISLQSGSDEILAKMNRRYTSEIYLEKINSVRQVLGDVAITTDVIIGFPGETEIDFEKTVIVSEKSCFARMHIFPFSSRVGTAASRLTQSIKPQEVQKRHQALFNVSQNLAHSFKKRFIGKKVRVLAETEENGTASGYSDHYLVTEFSGGSGVRGRLVEVEVTEATPQKLVGCFVRVLE